jgi:hypothetical protein
MERLRAALVGCILTGGVLFGSRPVLPDDEVVRPVVSTSGPGTRIGMTADELARWVRPFEFGGAVALSLPSRSPVGTVETSAVPQVHVRIRRRCSAGRVRRRARY